MASRVFPEPLLDAPHCPSQCCLRGPTTCVFATCFAVPLSSPVPQCVRHEDAPESVSHASIARPCRLIPEAA